MLYQLSYGPLAFSFSYFEPPYGDHHGQGRNRTADTMIFSHVLYQLSYLAETKNPPEPVEARAGNDVKDLFLESFRPRPGPRAPRVGDRPEFRHLPLDLPQVPNVGNAAVRRRFPSYSGGRIRTCDLRVMSPTSYQTAPPRNRTGNLVEIRRQGQPAVRHRRDSVEGASVGQSSRGARPVTIVACR